MSARWRLNLAREPSSSGRAKAKFRPAAILPMLDKFHDIIGGIHVPVDDGVDKLNRKYTLLVFLFLALPIFTKQYIGDPIECFAPVYFAEHQSRYINSYCWTQSTYYMVPVGDPDDDGDQQEPSDRIMPDEVDYFIGFETVTHIGNERLRRVRVSYYQWAPLILLVQGLCFYIPFLIWNSCANNAGVKLRRLLKKASDIASLPPGCQQREALLAEFVDQFHTLVTGEAGWCADLQCGGGGLGALGGSGNSSNGSSASNSSANSGQSANGLAAPSHGAGRAGGPQTRQPQAGANSGDHGDGHGRANGRGGGHDSGPNSNSNNNANTNHHNNNPTGCCLVSIPIIGSLLACCLKPCSSFGLVGPSKYLCLLYLAVKFAYVFNVGLQFFLLGQFLGRGYLKHGLELINRLIVNGDWWASPRLWEFYANQMKLQEDANQLALANSAQHALSNTNTAISSQHQLMAAAAAAASNHQLGPGNGPGSGNGSHSHGHSHGGGGGGHLHGPPPMMGPPPSHQHSAQHPHHHPAAAGAAQNMGGAPGAGHFGHSHAHAAHNFAHGGGGPPMAPLVPHSAHAHHSGQISQPGGHHPLHAANTHAHHAHHMAAGPFGPQSNASLLAQLQHQQQQQQKQQQQQQQQHHHQANQQTNSNSTNSAPLLPNAGGGNNQNNQQSASGNVAAAVAALAAAAAANSSATNQATPGIPQQQQVAQPSLVAAIVSASAGSAQVGSNAQTANAAAPASVSLGGTGPTPSMQANAIHLHSPMQQQQQAGQGAIASQPAGGSGVPSGVSAGIQQQSVSGAVASGQQQALAGGTGTTSFINSGAVGSGPPLPPPPPAHVVAAVAASVGSVGAGQPAAPGMARTGAQTLGRQAPPMATGSNQQQQQQQQQQQSSSASNPILFNLKSANNMQVAAANGSRYSPHTIAKR